MGLEQEEEEEEAASPWGSQTVWSSPLLPTGLPLFGAIALSSG